MCTGTLSLLKKAGWSVHIATMAPGDKGTAEYTREDISSIRKSEASESAKLLSATYHCLEFEDVYIMYDRESINRTTSLIRKIKPSLVFTHSPNDYMIDHETTSKIVQTACFSASIKNLEITETNGMLTEKNWMLLIRCPLKRLTGIYVSIVLIENTECLTPIFTFQKLIRASISIVGKMGLVVQ